MEETLDRNISNMDGAAALPRSNGELVFDAPWESRAFGIAVALHGDRRFDWHEFRGELIEQITSVEADAHAHAQPRMQSGDSHGSYYGLWLTSLERVLANRGLISLPEVETRAAEYASGARSDDDH